MARVLWLGLVAALVCNAAFAQSLSPAEEAATLQTATLDASSIQPGVPPSQVSFGALVRDLGRQFRHLPSLETATILGVGGAMSAWVHSEDAEITRQWSRSAKLDRVFEPGETLGSGWIHAGGALGTYFLGHRTKNPRLVTLGAELLRAQAVNAVLTQGLSCRCGAGGRMGRTSRFRPGTRRPRLRRRPCCTGSSGGSSVRLPMRWRHSSAALGSRRTVTT